MLGPVCYAPPLRILGLVMWWFEFVAVFVYKVLIFLEILQAGFEPFGINGLYAYLWSPFRMKKVVILLSTRAVVSDP